MDKWTRTKDSERNRFTISFALSINKTVSKIGTGEGKPKDI
jgi:hypothetical protein